MANFIAKQVSKRILKESTANNFGSQDAYYEQVPATDLNGNPTGKTVKRPRAVPEGISKHDAKILNKVKRRAHRLDSSINFCGIRLGWSAIIGIIPGLGDLLDVFMALMVYRTCCKVEDLDNNTKSKMVMNIVIDAFIGLVPVLGDFADALWRCNTKNAIELEKFLTKKGQRAKQAAIKQGNGGTQQPMFVDQPGRANMAYPGGDGALDAPPRYEASGDGLIPSQHPSPGYGQF
ncbi:MAG: PH domain-containing [Lasallia pustulata]|uniref:PH domain-containing n=1 Tax=Lasallia pustulata TaxID=136370 RepID=A0A5M8PHZ1_9LECA|nr:MAG: PH domain-containing [Lasallia pustulata]